MSLHKLVHKTLKIGDHVRMVVGNPEECSSSYSNCEGSVTRIERPSINIFIHKGHQKGNDIAFWISNKHWWYEDREWDD